MTLRIGKTLLIFLLITILIILMSGFRLTANQAAKTNSNVDHRYELVNSVEVDEGLIFIYKNNEENIYRSTLISKHGLLYRGFGGGFWYQEQEEDMLKTIGYGSLSTSNNKNEFTILVVETMTPKVHYVEAGLDGQRQKIAVNKEELAVMYWPQSINHHDLNAVALGEDGKVLYKYANHPKKTASLYNLRWYPIDLYEN